LKEHDVSVLTTSANRMKLALTIILMSMAAGCASHSQHDMEQAETSDNRDALEAYLIIGASILPSEEPPAKWIALHSRTMNVHIPTSEAIYGMYPGNYKVVHFDLHEIPIYANHTDISFWKTPRVKLEAGKIYYYGRLEVTKKKNQIWSRTVQDPALFRRACEDAPELFQQFEVVVVGPLAKDHNVVLPPCDELLSKSGSESAQVRD
jgi:hypothetical protein